MSDAAAPSQTVKTVIAYAIVEPGGSLRLDLIRDSRPEAWDALLAQRAAEGTAVTRSSLKSSGYRCSQAKVRFFG